MENVTQKTKISKFGNKSLKLLFPLLVTVLGSILLITTVFLPFASATDNHKEYLEKYSDTLYVEEFDMTKEDAIDISLFEFLRMYSILAEKGIHKSISIACVVIISIFAGFSLLTLIFSVFKKAIPTLIFSLLSYAAFYIIKWDFKDRGVIPSNDYNWGVAEIVCYVGVIVAIIGAIALLIMKIINKKTSKTEEEK